MNNLAFLLRRARVRIALSLYHMGLAGIAEFTPGMGLDEIKAEYADTLYNTMAEYLGSTRPITAFRNEFSRATNDAMTLAFYAGWVDGGGTGPITDEMQAWLNERINSELGYINELFPALKELRDNSDKSEEEKLAYAQSRADGYTSSLDAVYSYGRSYAEDEMWEFGGESGLDSCETCQDLMGQIHPASWWRENELIPGPGGDRHSFECGLWRCRHNLRNGRGEIVAGWMG